MGGLEGGGPGGQGWQGPQTQHLLGHHADLHTEDAALLFGGGPLQAHVSAGEFHGEFHFDLVGGKAGTTPQGMSAQGVPPNTGAPQDCTWGLPETLTGWEWEGCRQRRGEGLGGLGEAWLPTHCADTSGLSRLTPFISITSVCQFLVSTVCGSSCRERKRR